MWTRKNADEAYRNICVSVSYFENAVLCYHYGNEVFKEAGEEETGFFSVSCQSF